MKVIFGVGARSFGAIASRWDASGRGADKTIPKAGETTKVRLDLDKPLDTVVCLSGPPVLLSERVTQQITHMQPDVVVGDVEAHNCELPLYWEAAPIAIECPKDMSTLDQSKRIFRGPKGYSFYCVFEFLEMARTSKWTNFVFRPWCIVQRVESLFFMIREGRIGFRIG